MKDKDIQWITVNGRHIPLHSGESKDEAVKKFFAKEPVSKEEDSVDRQQRQIAERKAEADRLNDERKDIYKGIPKQVDANSFVSKVATAKRSQYIDDKWRVDDTYSADDYRHKGCKCFVTDGGSTVGVTKDGDIISVCRNMNEEGRGIGKNLLAWAVKNGGKKLDSFGGNHDFYVKCGFEPVCWTPFSPKYAPKGWEYSAAENGEPVVFYKYVGVGNVKNTSLRKWMRSTKSIDDYDSAMAYRDKQIK